MAHICSSTQIRCDNIVRNTGWQKKLVQWNVLHADLLFFIKHLYIIRRREKPRRRKKTREVRGLSLELKLVEEFFLDKRIIFYLFLRSNNCSQNNLVSCVQLSKEWILMYQVHCSTFHFLFQLGKIKRYSLHIRHKETFLFLCEFPDVVNVVVCAMKNVNTSLFTLFDLSSDIDYGETKRESRKWLENWLTTFGKKKYIS